MIRRNLTLTALACLMLAACGTPQQQCISQNTREYRVVSNLLAEVQGNLVRGYAWEERSVTRTEWDDCPFRLRDKDGNQQIGYRPCLRDVTDTERYRVPIDPAAETRKAANLAERKAALQSRADAAVKACRAAYPE